MGWYQATPQTFLGLRMIYFCIGALFIIYLLVRIRQLRSIARKNVGWTVGRRGTRLGYVYFYRGYTDWWWEVKIGRSSNPYRRLQNQRTAKSHGIKVLAVFKTKDDVKAETLIKKLFASNRISTHNEWYYFSPGLWLYMVLLRDEDITERVQRWLG